MRTRYTGCFSNASGIIRICDPMATKTAIEYYNIEHPEEFNVLCKAPEGLYNVFNNIYIENDLESGYKACYSSHIAVIPDIYNGEDISLIKQYSINIGLSNIICILDDLFYDHPKYSAYGLLSDAIYNINDIFNNGIHGFTHSNMEPLENLTEEYTTGSTLLDMCNGIPELTCDKIRSTHWSEDTIYRARLMHDLGTVIYGGAACCANANESILSLYSFKEGIVLICSLLNVDSSADLRSNESNLRHQFISTIQDIAIDFSKVKFGNKKPDTRE